jgi:hypothetical protein
MAEVEERGTIMAAPVDRTDRAVLVGDVTAVQTQVSGGHELTYRNKAGWKKKLEKAMAVAPQEEHERACSRHSSPSSRSLGGPA